ncbi:MAG TPA: serine/threonine-protein kinase, partial [Burkholderiaceae bacterium]|nr:serine/threonine-protein kinase [Burkholderiaceae bacterium]
MLATTVANWQRLKTTLGKALELPVNKRVEYITTECQDDLALTQEILRLLAQHGVTEFMEAPPLPCELDDQTVWVGRQLGVYEITEELPPGGMGRVFKAKRADGQYESIVAIKVLRSAVDMPEIRQRFYIERQILAKLQHPNIAHMLDGGIVDGLPYFVMEYVDGVAIDKYCGDHHLPLNRRLQLLIAICHAVEAAHQQLIVHRDLKPENILVLEQEVPKLLDFGIAKLLTEESLDSKLATQTNVTKLGGTGPYTPSFAAPEQFKGQNITTATDVYGLGGVMYRLLTGGVPFESAGSDPLALMQRVCEQEAKQPSEVIELFNENSQRAIRRGLGSDSQLAHSLRGELNIIALKALAKEPSQRYQTVGQLRRDLENYLQGRPIVARPASLRYVALKFIQRHRALVVTAALGVLALAVGVAG